MEENRKRFLDKILKWFVNDTEVHPYVRTWFPKFLEEVENYPITLRPLDISLLSLFPITRFYDYCRITYDLSVEEIEYIWHKYTIIIIDKFNNEKPINESEDRRKKFLDKVVDFLVKDTKVDYDKRTLFFPFTYKRSLRQGTNNLTPFHKLLFDSYIPIDGFMEYIKELYDITSIEDITHVWETYKVIMNKIVFGDNASPLYFNESDDKKQVFLNKIIDWLVSDTDTSSLWFNPPYYNIGMFPDRITLNSLYKQTFNLLKYVYPEEKNTFVVQLDYFKKFCREQYGLTEEETIYVWEQYMKNSHIKENSLINESDDKKQEYLNKVVDWLVGDTEIGDGYWFSPPYYYPGSTSGRTGFKSVYEHTFGLLRNTSYSGLEVQLIYFDSYCKNNYGLTGEETKVVWFEYMKKLKESYDWRF
jgi:hypothetical protein